LQARKEPYMRRKNKTQQTNPKVKKPTLFTCKGCYYCNLHIESKEEYHHHKKGEVKQVATT
jgi:hypothetical protein